jgi:hypothetical protein
MSVMEHCKFLILPGYAEDEFSLNVISEGVLVNFLPYASPIDVEHALLRCGLGELANDPRFWDSWEMMSATWSSGAPVYAGAFTARVIAPTPNGGESAFELTFAEWDHASRSVIYRHPEHQNKVPADLNFKYPGD